MRWLPQTKGGIPFLEAVAYRTRHRSFLNASKERHVSEEAGCQRSPDLQRRHSGVPPGPPGGHDQRQPVRGVLAPDARLRGRVRGPRAEGQEARPAADGPALREEHHAHLVPAAVDQGLQGTDRRLGLGREGHHHPDVQGGLRQHRGRPVRNGQVPRARSRVVRTTAHARAGFIPRPGRARGHCGVLGLSSFVVVFVRLQNNEFASATIKGQLIWGNRHA